MPGTTLDPTLPTGTVFADFEGETWGEGWVGTDDFAPSDDPAVIDGPYPGTIGDQQQVTGYQGEQLVNTFTDHDASTGTITSPAFTISSNYINLLVGGGFHPWRDGATDATAVNLVIHGEVVATATGSDSELVNWAAWDVSQYQGSRRRSSWSTRTKAAGGTSCWTTSCSPPRRRLQCQWRPQSIWWSMGRSFGPPPDPTVKPRLGQLGRPGAGGADRSDPDR